MVRTQCFKDKVTSMAAGLNIGNVPAPRCGVIMKNIFAEAAHFAGGTIRQEDAGEESGQLWTRAIARAAAQGVDKLLRHILRQWLQAGKFLALRPDRSGRITAQWQKLETEITRMQIAEAQTQERELRVYERVAPERKQQGLAKFRRWRNQLHKANLPMHRDFCWMTVANRFQRAHGRQKRYSHIGKAPSRRRRAANQRRA